MSTPSLIKDEVSEPPRPPGEPGSTDNRLSVWVLRILSALIVPAVLLLFFFTFEFLQDPRTNKALQIAVAIVVGVGGVWLLFWAMDRLVSALPDRMAAGVRPFVFAGPALMILGFYLVYPTVDTIITSLRNADGSEFVGIDNFVRLFTESTYLVSLRNSVIWAIVVPIFCVGFGLAVAVLADLLPRKTEAVVKSLIFLPMAVSFVGASVVFFFMYTFRPEGFGEQIGLLNAIWTALGNDPVDWLRLPFWNNLFLMAILVWTQTGFAMVILSSAIKGVPDELLEAARIDGATEWQVFRKVTIPTIASTIVVVWTTILITTWKVYDIVAVMTGGRDGTSVVAERMVTEFYTFRNEGLGAALAVVLLVVVLPILIINIRRFQEQEATR
ncbi:MAG: sugar ABC transporter permease [Actinomycetes bacterium]|mgnify:FL=1|jgi:ABC-type sugar transport systems, permease components|nr:sugar ABC transporter permease [Acidimicrobiia bacterium]